jgi:hypothetical protein
LRDLTPNPASSNLEKVCSGQRDAIPTGWAAQTSEDYIMAFFSRADKPSEDITLMNMKGLRTLTLTFLSQKSLIRISF